MNWHQSNNRQWRTIFRIFHLYMPFKSNSDFPRKVQLIGSSWFTQTVEITERKTTSALVSSNGKPYCVLYIPQCRFFLHFRADLYSQTNYDKFLTTHNRGHNNKGTSPWKQKDHLLTLRRGRSLWAMVDGREGTWRALSDLENREWQWAPPYWSQRLQGDWEWASFRIL